MGYEASHAHSHPFFFGNFLPSAPCLLSDRCLNLTLMCQMWKFSSLTRQRSRKKTENNSAGKLLQQLRADTLKKSSWKESEEQNSELLIWMMIQNEPQKQQFGIEIGKPEKGIRKEARNPLTERNCNCREGCWNVIWQNIWVLSSLDFGFVFSTQMKLNLSVAPSPAVCLLVCLSCQSCSHLTSSASLRPPLPAPRTCVSHFGTFSCCCQAPSL